MNFCESLIISLFLCITGGSAAADKTRYDQAATAELRLPYYASGGGAGFASFCFILGFVLLCIGGVYISPICTGSINERKTLCAPQEIRALASPDNVYDDL